MAYGYNDDKSKFDLTEFLNSVEKTVSDAKATMSKSIAELRTQLTNAIREQNNAIDKVNSDLENAVKTFSNEKFLVIDRAFSIAKNVSDHLYITNASANVDSFSNYVLLNASMYVTSTGYSGADDSIRTFGEGWVTSYRYKNPGSIQPDANVDGVIIKSDGSQIVVGYENNSSVKLTGTIRLVLMRLS